MDWVEALDNDQISNSNFPVFGRERKRRAQSTICMKSPEMFAAIHRSGPKCRNMIQMFTQVFVGESDV